MRLGHDGPKFFRGLEHGHGPGRDFHGFSGPGVPGHARLAVTNLESAKTPDLDHKVIEAAAALSEAQRYAPLGSKRVLREIALADLDPGNFDRPKAGFVLPIEPWSRASLKGEIEATFEDRKRCESVGLDPNAVARLWRAYQAGAPGMYWSRIWALFVLLHWTHVHRVNL